MHNKELLNLCTLPSIISIIKSRRVRLAAHVVRICTHIVQTIGSQIAVRLTALRNGRALLPRNLIFLASGTHFC
jgi:hypothetical protein